MMVFVVPDIFPCCTLFCCCGDIFIVAAFGSLHFTKETNPYVRASKCTLYFLDKNKLIQLLLTGFSGTAKLTSPAQCRLWKKPLKLLLMRATSAFKGSSQFSFRSSMFCCRCLRSCCLLAWAFSMREISSWRCWYSRITCDSNGKMWTFAAK